MVGHGGLPLVRDSLGIEEVSFLSYNRFRHVVAPIAFSSLWKLLLPTRDYLRTSWTLPGARTSQDCAMKELEATEAEENGLKLN